MATNWNGEFGEKCNLPIDCVDCDITECPGRPSERGKWTVNPKVALSDAKFCPICGCKLHKDSDKLLCDRHGEMRVFLDRDPKAAPELTKLENLEAP
jgi:hypothetical protein